MTGCPYVNHEKILCPDVAFYRSARVEGVAKQHYEDSCKGGEHCAKRAELDKLVEKLAKGVPLVSRI
jgi:hypothetical protein